MSKGPRRMTPADQRRVSIEVAGFTDPRLVIVEQEPLRDQETGELLPVIVEDTHRGLQHLDGNSEPRPPKDWEDREAFDRYWEHAGVRADLTDELHAERAALRIHERLALVMRDLGTLQTPKAQQRRETDAKGAGDRDHAPTLDEGVAHAPSDEVARRILQIRLHVEALEDLLDEHRGLTHKSYVMMSSEEKDSLLSGDKFRGLTPEEIHALHPELGAPRTIRWVRERAGQTHRGYKQTRPPSERRPWTDGEDEAVLACEDGLRELAERLGRTYVAVRIRRTRLLAAADSSRSL